MAIVSECYYPRWRPIWPPKHKNVHISGNRLATITNEVSNLTLSRSMNRFIVVAILLECYYPRWRPIWPPKYKVCIFLKTIVALKTAEADPMVMTLKIFVCFLGL